MTMNMFKQNFGAMRIVRLDVAVDHDGYKCHCENNASAPSP